MGTFVTALPQSSGAHATGSALPDASAIQYVLPRAGMVSLAIYNGDILVRTLFAGDAQDAGPHKVSWDGLDRAGNALPVGQYSWRLLMNDGLTSDYISVIGQTPIQPNKPYEHMPGSHQGPSFGFVGSDGSYYQGARNSEGPPCMIKATTINGPMQWSRNWQSIGPIDMVELGGNLYLLTWAIKLQQVDPATSFNNGDPKYDGGIDLLWPGDTRPNQDSSIASYHVSLGVDGSNIMVAYQAHNRINWINPKNGSVFRTVSVPSPRYPRSGGPSGSICVLSGKDLVWIATNNSITPIVQGLTSPNAMDYDPTAQEFFVALVGKDQRVLRISISGSILKAFGRLGGRKYGRYVSQDFRDINYLQCDGAGGFYATETDSMRRVAHINSAGNVVKEWVGSGQFWLVASADPNDHDLVWYNNSYTNITVARMNRSDRTSHVVATYFMPAAGFADGLFPASSTLPQWRFVRKEGHGFLVHSSPPAILRVDEEKGLLLPLALLGTKLSKAVSFPGIASNIAINEAMVAAGLTYSDHGSDAYSWHDINGDGSVTAAGFRFHGSGALIYGDSTNVGMDDDFNLYIGRRSADTYVDTESRWMSFHFGNSPFLKIPNLGSSLAPIWDWSSQILSPAQVPNDLVPRDTSAVLWTPNGVFLALNSGAYFDKLRDLHGLIWPDDSYNSTEILCIRPDEKVFSFSKQKSRGLGAGAMYRWPAFFLGHTHDCIIAASRNYYGAVAWTYDGLYAGFFLDHHGNQLPDWVYKPGGWNLQGLLPGDDWTASGTLIDEADGSVLWLPRGVGDSGAFRVTGWDNWYRATGEINLTTVPNIATNGNGLVGTYYSNASFSGIPVATKTDERLWFSQTVNRDGVVAWNTGPCTGITATQAFSIRWTGYLVAPFSEKFWFRLYNVYQQSAFFQAQWWKTESAYAQFWLNDVLIIDLSKDSVQFIMQSGAWTDDEPSSFESSPVLLAAGEHYSLKVEYSYPGAALAGNSTNFISPEFALSWCSVTKEWSRIIKDFLNTGTVSAKPVVSVGNSNDNNEVTFSIAAPLLHPLTIRYRILGTDFVPVAGSAVILPNSKEVIVVVDPGDYALLSLEPDAGYFGDGTAGTAVFNHITVPAGLVAYYPMDEVRGVVAHDVIGSKHVVFESYMQPPLPTWDPGHGAHKGCLRFQEQGISHLTLPFPTIIGDFSLAFWFRVDPQTATFPLTRNILEIWQDSGRLKCLYNNWNVTVPSTQVNDGGWHQITVTMQSATRQIVFYVDGSSASTSGFGAVPITLGLLDVGYSNSLPNTSFIGSLDDFRIYGTTLSNIEVSLLARHF